jgi:hypothetical protein
MRSLPLLFGLLAALAVLSDSCLRKEEEDPFLSFRTRKNRVTGTWHVSTGSVIIDNPAYAVSYSIHDNTYVYTAPSGQSSGSCSVKFEFNKDGSAVLDFNIGGLVSTYKGTWNFTGRVGEHHNKTQIVIHPTTISDANGTRTIEGNVYDLTYDIQELKNKEMKLQLRYKEIDSGGNYDSYNEMWTLIQ